MPAKLANGADNRIVWKAFIRGSWRIRRKCDQHIVRAPKFNCKKAAQCSFSKNWLEAYLQVEVPCI